MVLGVWPAVKAVTLDAATHQQAIADVNAEMVRMGAGEKGRGLALDVAAAHPSCFSIDIQ
jgi:hypothetical protein